MIRRTSVGRLRREAGDAIGIGPCVKPGRTVQVARLWMGWDGMEWYGMVYGLRLVWVFEIWREGDSFVCTHDLSINLSPGETIASTLSLSRASSNTVLSLHVWSAAYQVPRTTTLGKNAVHGDGSRLS